MSDKQGLAPDQIKDLFGKYHASREKLDYFLCGIAGALVAYLGQNFSPEKMPSYAAGVTILSLAFLLLAFCCGYFCIRAQNSLTRLNFLEIETSHLIQKMFESMTEYQRREHQGLPLKLTNEMGEPYTLARLQSEKAEKENELLKMRQGMELERISYSKLGRARDALIALGFVALIVAKTLQWKGF
jgi:hypothetical protein